MLSIRYSSIFTTFEVHQSGPDQSMCLHRTTILETIISILVKEIQVNNTSLDFSLSRGMVVMTNETNTILRDIKINICRPKTYILRGAFNEYRQHTVWGQKGQMLDFIETYVVQGASTVYSQQVL